jgi:transposase
VKEETDAASMPTALRHVLLAQVEQLGNLRREIAGLDQQMIAWHRAVTESKLLATIPGVGVITASAILASVGDGKQFRSGREFAAWIGLVPRQSSSGGKEKLSRISKRGNHYLRRLLITGATVPARQTRRESGRRLLVRAASAPQARKGGVRRARQQNGAYCLGGVNDGRMLPGIRGLETCGGIKVWSGRNTPGSRSAKEIGPTGSR